MRINNTINELRKCSVPKANNGRIAVVVLTPYMASRANYGIQFWTPEMIKIGTSQNTDNTISTFVEKL